MDWQTLHYEKENSLGIINFNRPQVLNAMNEAMVDELIVLLEEIEKDDEVKCLILYGGMRAFVAGGDIAYMSTVNAVECEKFIDKTQQMMDKIASFNKPVIAAMAGLALGGGCELALTCDIRIAAEGTIMGVPESNLGLFPAAGGTQRLTRVVGIGWATHMILTGDPIDTDTAMKIGLITKVVPGEQLLEEAKNLAAKLAAKSPLTTKVTKQCLKNAISTDLPTGLMYEQKAFAFLFATEDKKEGVTAFLEKRQPNFTGR